MQYTKLQIAFVTASPLCDVSTLHMYLEQDFSPINVANASHSSLVHEQGANGLLTDSHLLPEQLPVSIPPQGVRAQLGRLLLVVGCRQGSACIRAGKIP